MSKHYSRRLDFVWIALLGFIFFEGYPIITFSLMILYIYALLRK